MKNPADPSLGLEEHTEQFYEEKIYNRTDHYKISNDMAKKIREYDSNYFVVIISNYAWEKHFSEDLGRTIENCGGWLIKEFTNLGSARFGNFTEVSDF